MSNPSSSKRRKLCHNPDLPADVINYIFSFFTPNRYLECRLVSKKMKQKVETNPVWRRIMQAVKIRIGPDLYVHQWDGLPLWRQFVKYTFAGGTKSRKRKLALISIFCTEKNDNNLRIITSLIEKRQKDYKHGVLELLLTKYLNELEETKSRVIHEFDKHDCGGIHPR